MTVLRHVAPYVFVGVAFGCASDRKNVEPPMRPASYEPMPDTTAEPKGLPPTATEPGDPSKGAPEAPANESPGTLEKQGPAAPPPGVGGSTGKGGMAGMGAAGGAPPRSPIGKE
jgi:hypothetical protein